MYVQILVVVDGCAQDTSYPENLFDIEIKKQKEEELLK